MSILPSTLSASEQSLLRKQLDLASSRITIAEDLDQAMLDFKTAMKLSGGSLYGPTTSALLALQQPAYSLDKVAGLLAVPNAERILRHCWKQGLRMVEQMAYVMATVQHETANTYQPVVEGFWLTPDGRRRLYRTLRYSPYFGRGFCQLTWRNNYEFYSQLLNLPLTSNPDLVLEPEVSAFILAHGMRTGQFGKPLTSAISPVVGVDYVQARRSVNVLDKAEKIAGLAKQWEARLRKAGVR